MFRFGNMIGVKIPERSFCVSYDEDLHDDSELNRLVSLVYAPDDKTGIASSDLNILVSDSVNPQIADWVRSQLLRPVGFAPSSIMDGQQVDEETLFALTRNHGETQAEYVDRVNQLLIQWNTNDKGD